ncbi:hypothetical protein OHS58_42285 [Amycolatopsis sp. NBC_00348]|uniref:hypothetical protein n=1 Tax=Amycolatopsis sp. NBC_00348 TaxID=2975956 RepID=UPI002E273CCB
MLAGLSGFGCFGRAWEAPADVVIGRLLDSFAQNGTSGKAPERAQDEPEVHAIDAAERTTRYSQEKSPAGKQVEAIDAGGRFAARLLDWRHMVFFAWLVSLLGRRRR